MAGGYTRFEPSFLDAIRARVSLYELIGPSIAKLKRAGSGDWSGLCPFHAERTPSFYIVEKKAFWHCFGCGAHGDAFGWIRQTTNAQFPEAVEYLAAKVGLRPAGSAPKEIVPREIIKRPAAEALKEERDKRIRIARRIWSLRQLAGPGTPVDAYLRGRGIWIAQQLQIPTIAYVPRLEHPFLTRGGFAKARGESGFPAMVTPFADLDRKIVGVECTFLMPGPNGAWVKMQAPPGWPKDQKWKPKAMCGDCSGAAMRLTPAEDVMVLAEGRETALSVLQALYDDEVKAPHIDGEPVGVWACGGKSFIGACELPVGVREVIIAADSDNAEPAADSNQKDPEDVLQLAAERHREKGRNVRIARPQRGTDFNDMLAPGTGGRGDDDEEDIAA